MVGGCFIHRRWVFVLNVSDLRSPEVTGKIKSHVIGVITQWVKTSFNGIMKAGEDINIDQTKS